MTDKNPYRDRFWDESAGDDHTVYTALGRQTGKTELSTFRIYAEIDRRMAARKKLAHRRKLLIWLGGPYLALVMACVALSPVSGPVAFWLGFTIAVILLYLGKLIRED